MTAQLLITELGNILHESKKKHTELKNVPLAVFLRLWTRAHTSFYRQRTARFKTSRPCRIHLKLRLLEVQFIGLLIDTAAYEY